jgi:hypothetical protein
MWITSSHIAVTKRYSGPRAIGNLFVLIVMLLKQIHRMEGLEIDNNYKGIWGSILQRLQPVNADGSFTHVDAISTFRGDRGFGGLGDDRDCL